jgi:hypothetical protein
MFQHSHRFWQRWFLWRSVRGEFVQAFLMGMEMCYLDLCLHAHVAYFVCVCVCVCPVIRIVLILDYDHPCGPHINLIISAKTLSLNKVTFWRGLQHVNLFLERGHSLFDSNHSFWRFSSWDLIIRLFCYFKGYVKTASSLILPHSAQNRYLLSYQ